MGKNAKITGDVPEMEASSGVRTRAQTLALQQNLEHCYLQLRSRTVQKPQFPSSSSKKPSNRSATAGASHVHGSRPAPRSFNSVHALSASSSLSNKGKSEEEEGGLYGTDVDDFSAEASFGENILDLDLDGRGMRESSPSSLIRDFDSNGTYQNSVQRSNPYTYEMEELFAGSEMQQQHHFVHKYNFDIVNDLPLSGRYDWVRIGF